MTVTKGVREKCFVQALDLWVEFRKWHYIKANYCTPTLGPLKSLSRYVGMCTVKQYLDSYGDCNCVRAKYLLTSVFVHLPSRL